MTRRLTFWIGGLALAALCTACAQSDAGITTLVKTKLDADRSMTSNATIHVETNKHVVTLSGKAASDSEKSHAVQVARQTDGVKEVVDNLAVDPSVAPPPVAPSRPGAAPSGGEGANPPAASSAPASPGESPRQ